MITSISTFLILSIISLFPIVIWWYIFAYIDDNPINKQRFLIWILGWILSVFPIFYMDKIISLFNFKYLDVFSFVYKLNDFFSTINFFISLSLFLLLLVIFSFIFWFSFIKTKNLFKIYFRNLIVFLFWVIFLSCLLFLLNFLLDFSIFNNIQIKEINFDDIIFDSFKLVVFYYFIVAFIEETSKHFNFIQSSILYVDSIKTWVLYSIFVALWFGLIENILYLNSALEQTWLNYDFLKIYFFRSFFSVMVHVICSSVISYYFCKALLIYRNKNLIFPYLKTFLTWLFLWVIFHLIFDVSLSLWFIFIIFVYFIGWYLYVSSIFYREE